MRVGRMGTGQDYVIPYRKGMLRRMVADLAKGQYPGLIGKRAVVARLSDDDAADADASTDFPAGAHVEYSDDDSDEVRAWDRQMRASYDRLPRPALKAPAAAQARLVQRLPGAGGSAPDEAPFRIERAHGVIVMDGGRCNWGDPDRADLDAAAYFEALVEELDELEPGSWKSYTVSCRADGYVLARDDAYKDNFAGDETAWLAEFPDDLLTGPERARRDALRPGPKGVDDTVHGAARLFASP